MPESVSCRRSVIVSILAVIAMAICLLVPFGGIGMRQAYANEIENIAFSVPAKVPFAMKADGTVIGPSTSAWRIKNEGARPLRLKDVAASGFDDGSTVSAVSEAMPVAGTSARGIWLINVSPGGGISLTPSVDGTIEIPVGGSAGFAWSADSPDGTKHAVGPVPIVLGTVSFTCGGANRIAFAVYSADDGSLNFYKRMDIPEAGDTFEGKTVTAVYTGLETDVYGLSIEDNWNGPYTTPWYEYKDNILSVKVIDDGIEPANTRFWFGNLSNVESIDLSKIKAPKDQSDCYLDLFVNCKKLKHIDFGALAFVSPIRMDSAFAGCSSLKSVDLSRLDTSGTQNFAYLFQNCTSLEEIKGSDTLVNVGTNRIECMFENCKSLSSLDLSGWTVNSKMLYCLATFYGCNALTKVKVGRGFCVPVDQHGNYAVLPVPSSDSISSADGKWYSVTTGRGYAPANIPADAADTYVASKELLPKVAFAVYSEDDESLDFYKRAFCDVPAVGSTFDGKVVTEVYTGFENETYFHIAGDSWKTWTTNVPWSSLESNIVTAEAIDEGIQPKSIAFWFYRCTVLKTVDLSKMNLSKVELTHDAFLLCRSLASITLAPFGQSLSEMSDFITGCNSLESLDLSSSDLSNVTCFWHFALNDGKPASLKYVRFPTDPKKQPKSVYNMSCMFSDQHKLEKIEGFGNSGWGFESKTNSAVDLSSCFLNCAMLNLDCSQWNVSSVTNHDSFNLNAPRVKSPKWV